MVFYIFDQGARSITPLDRLSGRRGVPLVSPVSASARISADTPVKTVEPVQPYRQQSANTAAEDHAGRRQLLFASDIMSSPVKFLRPEQSLQQAQAVMSEGQFHHLPIVNQQQQLSGILSDGDIWRSLAKTPSKKLSDSKIETIMTQRVISASADTEIRVMAEVMCSQRIAALPIVDEGNRLLGLVTRSDILRSLIHSAPLELWA